MPLVVRVVVFIVITVVAMDMWRCSATGRRKLRLVVLHRVLVILVLEDLRGVLLVQRHRRFSFCFVALRLLRRQELDRALFLLTLFMSLMFLLFLI
jgi:hypothetical protein